MDVRADLEPSKIWNPWSRKYVWMSDSGTHDNFRVLNHPRLVPDRELVHVQARGGGDRDGGGGHHGGRRSLHWLSHLEKSSNSSLPRSVTI